jgi:hypothetical protein
VIPLPEGANAEQAKAQFENGVPEVAVPIPESQRHRRSISINGPINGLIKGPIVEPTEPRGGTQSQAASGGSRKVTGSLLPLSNSNVLFHTMRTRSPGAHRCSLLASIKT